MKKIIYSLLLIAFCSSLSCAQEKVSTKSVLNAQTEIKTLEREKFDPNRNAAEDLRAAITKAQKENKRIILDVGGEWCFWCRLMDEYLAKNSDLAALRDANFIWLKINMSEENENAEFLSAYPKATGYPHLYILEKDGAFLYSKDTAELEDGKSYNKAKFTEFLEKWSPAKDSRKS